MCVCVCRCVCCCVLQSNCFCKFHLESTPHNIFDTAWVTCWRLMESQGKSQLFYQIMLPTWLRCVVWHSWCCILTPLLLVDDGEIWVSTHCAFSSNGLRCAICSYDERYFCWQPTLAEIMRLTCTFKPQKPLSHQTSWSFPLTNLVREMQMLCVRGLFERCGWRRMMVNLTWTCGGWQKWKITPPNTRWFT